jgi:hypothetical protein
LPGPHEVQPAKLDDCRAGAAALLAGTWFLCDNNIFAWLVMLLYVGLAFLWVWGGGLSGSSKYPPP